MNTRPSLSPIVAMAVAGVLGVLPARLAAQSAPDDNYHFAGEPVKVTLATADGGLRFAWPPPIARAGAAAWDTAILGVRVDAGSESDPWVEMQAGSQRLEQHLEASARGLRWLNLSGLKSQLTAGAEVKLLPHGLSIEPDAMLRTFANGLDLGKAVLILAPHPDDAEIAAFGLYADRNATVVTVTSGNAGDMNYRDNFTDGAAHYLFKGFLRAADSVTVPLQGGIPPERCANLGYFDARLAAMHDKPAEVLPELYGPNQDVSVYRRVNSSKLVDKSPRTNTWAHLVEDLETVLKKVKPGIIVMPHPSLDTHKDHEYTSVAAVEALARTKQNAVFLLYTNHSYENLYPFGPAGTVMALPPWAGRELAVERMYSHPVSPELQRRKLFALESMHDLRLSPAEQNGCLPPGTPSKRDDYPRTPAFDYFRRGPRANEMYFVFGPDGVRNVIKTFLDDRAAHKEPPR
jgi:LmbE family N-acetylglucosaminyl deacetylase